MSPRWTTAPMNEAHLPEVLAIERRSYRSPWPEEAFRADLGRAEWAHALVLLDETEPSSGVRGYICFWTLEGELSIHNVAVRPEDRRLGGASHLLDAAFEEGGRAGCLWAWLDVRPSNAAANALYARHGFSPVARRQRYYQDTGEDAIVMRAPVPSPGRPPAS